MINVLIQTKYQKTIVKIHKSISHEANFFREKHRIHKWHLDHFSVNIIHVDFINFISELMKFV